MTTLRRIGSFHCSSSSQTTFCWSTAQWANCFWECRKSSTPNFMATKWPDEITKFSGHKNFLFYSNIPPSRCMCVMIRDMANQAFNNCIYWDVAEALETLQSDPAYVVPRKHIKWTEVIPDSSKDSSSLSPTSHPNKISTMFPCPLRDMKCSVLSA